MTVLKPTPSARGTDLSRLRSSPTGFTCSLSVPNTSCVLGWGWGTTDPGDERGASERPAPHTSLHLRGARPVARGYRRQLLGGSCRVDRHASGLGVGVGPTDTARCVNTSLSLKFIYA